VPELARFKTPICDPTDWLSELLKLSHAIKISFDDLYLAINPKTN
jgi:hypothetical protein